MPDQFFNDKVAIITGASSGIGRATALALAGRGAKVALAARRQTELDQLKRQIISLGSDALVIPTDVSDPHQVEVMASTTLAHWGRADLLVANAGQYLRASISSINLALIEQSLAVNYYGAIRTVQAFLPSLLTQGRGHIVLVSSMDGKKGLPPDAPYVAAKFALSGYGEVLRQELYGTGIHVTLVFPGRVDTAMIEHLDVPRLQPKVSAESVAEAILRGIQRRQAEVYVPPFARLLVLLNALSPRSADWVARTFHLEGREKKN